MPKCDILQSVGKEDKREKETYWNWFNLKQC